jgi:hypothetical protein
MRVLLWRVSVKKGGEGTRGKKREEGKKKEGYFTCQTGEKRDKRRR